MTNSIRMYRSAFGDLKDRSVWVTTAWKVALVAAIYLIITAPPLLAAEQTQAAHPDAGHYHLNGVGLFLGGIYEDTHHGSENAFTIGFSYERRLSALLGVGGFYEYAAGDIDKWSIGVPLFIHPYHAWRLQLAPGLEHRESKDVFLFRIGVSYDFMISKQWFLVPEVNVDLVDGEEAFVFGLTLGFGF